MLEEGFIRWNNQLNEEQDQLELILWNLLNNKDIGGVNSNNLMIYLGAIMNIYIPELVLKGNDNLLTKAEVNKIHKEFYSYYVKKSTAVKTNNIVDNYPHSPELCKYSVKIISKNRSKKDGKNSIQLNKQKEE